MAEQIVRGEQEASVQRGEGIASCFCLFDRTGRFPVGEQGICLESFSVLFGSFRCRLQVYGSFALVGGEATDAEHGADGIEETARARRNHRVQAMLPLEKDGGGFLFGGETELLTEGDGIFRAADGMEQGDGEPPAFTRSKVASHMEEGGDGAET